MTPKILDQVPWDAAMPALPQSILIAASSVVAVLAVWFIVMETRRRRDWVPLFAFLGGGVAIIYEPLGDTLASVLYPAPGQIGWINLFGREIPLFIGVLYFWYMSVPALYFLRRVEQGLTRVALWRLYAITVLLAIGIEMFGVNLNAWIYYGPHPFVVLGVPLWCPLTYSAFLVTISMGLQAMATRLDRRHHWLIIPGVPLCLIGGHCASALPAAAAMFSTDDPRWIWLGGSLSIGVSLLLAYVATQVYCVDGAHVAVRRPLPAAPSFAVSK